MASSQDCKKFIAEIAPVIQKVAKDRGYPICSTVIAQACIESAYGTSSLGWKYHNYFGMKCGSAWKGPSVNMRTKEEYSVGTLTTIRDNFRVYPDMESGVNGYYDFISSKRYSNLKTATTPQMYAERLKSDGYATSSTYVNTLMNTVRKWNLDKYDSNNPVTDTIKDPKPVLKLGSKGDWVTIAQGRLVVNGYPVAVDGIYGPKTMEAVKQYQKANGLLSDGVVGPATWGKLYSSMGL